MALAALLVALATLLEAALVRDARSELRLAAPEPVAVARDLLISEDLDAMSEETEEPAEPTADETEEATLEIDEATELVMDCPAEAADEVWEEITLWIELAAEPRRFVVEEPSSSWAWKHHTVSGLSRKECSRGLDHIQR